jgi:hypothetical protein
MRAPARHSTANTLREALDAAEEDYPHLRLSPGERIVQAPAATGRKAMLRGVIILITLGGGWALIGGQATWPGWLLAEIAALPALMESKAPQPVAPTRPTVATNDAPMMQPAALDATPLPLPPQDPNKSPAASDAAARSPTPPLAANILPPTTARVDEPAQEPLPPPAADPADPYQVRAVAVGLHPDLSRVLLARLSPTDYRNAGIAIQTAVAETPDTAVFVWPRQRKPELALFQVRFVPGAAPGCRRYVVSVTKDGWLTTALPMERCGRQPGPQRRG